MLEKETETTFIQMTLNRNPTVKSRKTWNLICVMMIVLCKAGPTVSIILPLKENRPLHRGFFNYGKTETDLVGSWVVHAFYYGNNRFEYGNNRFVCRVIVLQKQNTLDNFSRLLCIFFFLLTQNNKFQSMVLSFFRKLVQIYLIVSEYFLGHIHNQQYQLQRQHINDSKLKLRDEFNDKSCEGTGVEKEWSQVCSACHKS